MSAAVHDFAIVGGGMAGASLAAELAGDASVVVIEAEEQPGYHTTGRSAAFWEECYGGPAIVPLTLASGAMLRDGGFLNPRGALFIGRAEDRAAMDAYIARFAGFAVSMTRLAPSRLAQQVPGIKDEWCDAIWEPSCADIDVAGLHAHYLKRARAGHAQIATRARLVQARREGGLWHLTMQDGARYHAAILVNAAGAWADNVASLAGARPLGITPYLRNIVQIRVDPGAPDDMPLVLDISGRFYFKPENGRIWLSPNDETPSVPHDAAADKLAVAEAIDRFEHVVNWRVQAVEHKWAGLRSFAPDRVPVYGPDPECDGFAWFAGQGGFGIQTAPAAALLMADLLLKRERTSQTAHIDMKTYDPERIGWIPQPE